MPRNVAPDFYTGLVADLYRPYATSRAGLRVVPVIPEDGASAAFAFWLSRDDG